jgi:excisionase family DNA binding protein
MSGTTNEPQFGTVPSSVREAAQRLGLSERGVLKRIHAGTLRAERHGKRWIVLLPPEPSSEPSTEPIGTANRTSSERTEPIEAEYRVVPAEQQAAVVNLVREMIEPFVKELGETREQLGRVTAERDQARIQAEMAALEREQIQAERDALEARLSVLEAAHVKVPQSQPDAPQTQLQRVWWAFWRRAN